MSNPYQPGQTISPADLDQGDSYQPEIAELDGRIGRLRFFTYLSFGLILIGFIGNFVTSFVAAATPDKKIRLMIYLLVLYLPLLVWLISVARRRLHDINRSGWLVLLMLLPLVNVLAILALPMLAGDSDANRFGKPAHSKLTGRWAPLLLPLDLLILFGLGYLLK